MLDVGALVRTVRPQPLTQHSTLHAPTLLSTDRLYHQYTIAKIDFAAVQL